MDRFSSELPRLVFQRSIHEDAADVSMDNDMLSVLSEIDGQRTAADLAADLGMSMNGLRAVLARLDDKGLIAQVRQAAPVLSPQTVAAMKKHLVHAVGPMGEVLFEDVAEELGLEAETIPMDKAAELIEALAEDIPDQGARQRFKTKLLHMIDNSKETKG